MFRKPDRSADSNVPIPTRLHVGAYLTGGLKELYHRISRGESIDNSDADVHTNEKGQFRPGHDGPVVMAQRYYITEVLTTRGQSAVLVYAEDLFNQNKVVVIKVLHTSYFTIGAQEAECLRRLAGADPLHVSHTVKLLNTFIYGGHFCMVFESLCPQPITEIFDDLQLPNCQHLQKVKKLTLQLLVVLGFLRQQNTIHADLKPENILLKHGNDLTSVQVIDFGNSIQHVHKEVSLYYRDFDVQTLLYRAPEVMFGIPFGTEIDMWSLGCILAELYLGRPLFFGKSKTQILTSITSILGPLPKEIFQRGKFSQDLEQFTASVEQEDATHKLMEHLSGSRDYAFANFLAQLFRYDPDERLSPSGAAQHPFLAQELCVSFLLPVTTKKQQTSSILLNSSTYKNSVKISSEVKRQNPSTYDLLVMGTERKHQSSYFETKVAEVQPYKQERDTYPHPGGLRSSRSCSPHDFYQQNHQRDIGYGVSSNRVTSPYQTEHFETKHSNDSGFYERMDNVKSEEKYVSSCGRSGLPAFDLRQTLPSRSSTSCRSQVRSRSPLRYRKTHKQRLAPDKSRTLRIVYQEEKNESQHRNKQPTENLFKCCSPQRDKSLSRDHKMKIRNSFHSPVKVVVKAEVPSFTDDGKDGDASVKFIPPTIKVCSVSQTCPQEHYTGDYVFRHKEKAGSYSPAKTFNSQIAPISSQEVTDRKVELSQREHVDSLEFSGPSSDDCRLRNDGVLIVDCDRSDEHRSNYHYSKLKKTESPLSLSESIRTESSASLIESKRTESSASLQRYKNSSSYPGKLVSPCHKTKPRISRFSVSPDREDVDLITLELVEADGETRDIGEVQADHDTEKSVMLWRQDCLNRQMVHQRTAKEQEQNTKAAAVVYRGSNPVDNVDSIPNRFDLPTSDKRQDIKSQMIHPRTTDEQKPISPAVVSPVLYKDPIPESIVDQIPSPRGRSPQMEWKMPLEVKSRRIKTDSSTKNRKKLILEQAEIESVQNRTTLLVSDGEDLSGDEARGIMLETTVQCEETVKKTGEKICDVYFIHRGEKHNTQRDVLTQDSAQHVSHDQSMVVMRGTSQTDETSTLTVSEGTSEGFACIDNTRTVTDTEDQERICEEKVKMGKLQRRLEKKRFKAERWKRVREDQMKESAGQSKHVSTQLEDQMKESSSQLKQVSTQLEDQMMESAGQLKQVSTQLEDEMKESAGQLKQVSTQLDDEDMLADDDGSSTTVKRYDNSIVQRNSSSDKDEGESTDFIDRLDNKRGCLVSATLPIPRYDQYDYMENNDSDIVGHAEQQKVDFGQPNSKGQLTGYGDISDRFSVKVISKTSSDCIKASQSPARRSSKGSDSASNIETNSKHYTSRNPQCNPQTSTVYCSFDASDDKAVQQTFNEQVEESGAAELEKKVQKDDSKSTQRKPGFSRNVTFTPETRSVSDDFVTSDDKAEQLQERISADDMKVQSNTSKSSRDNFSRNLAPCLQTKFVHNDFNDSDEEAFQQTFNEQFKKRISSQVDGENKTDHIEDLNFRALSPWNKVYDTSDKARCTVVDSDDLNHSRTEKQSSSSVPRNAFPATHTESESSDDDVDCVPELSKGGNKDTSLECSGSAEEPDRRPEHPERSLQDRFTPVASSSPGSDQLTSPLLQQYSSHSDRSVGHCEDSIDSLAENMDQDMFDIVDGSDAEDSIPNSIMMRKRNRPHAKRQLKFARAFQRKQSQSKGITVAARPSSGHQSEVVRNSGQQEKKSGKDPFEFVSSQAKRGGVSKPVSSFSGSSKPKTSLSNMKKKTVCKRNVVATKSRRKPGEELVERGMNQRLAKQSSVCDVPSSVQGGQQKKRNRKGEKISHTKSDTMQSLATGRKSDSSDSQESITSKVCVRKRRRTENLDTDNIPLNRSNNGPTRNAVIDKNSTSNKLLSPSQKNIENLIRCAIKITPRNQTSTPRITKNSVQAAELDESIIFVTEKVESKPKQMHNHLHGEGRSRKGRVVRSRSKTPREKRSIDADDEEEVLLIS